jgi:sterol 14-demethylase
MKSTPPVLSGPPVIGHLLQFQKDRTGFFRRGYETLGPVFGFRLGAQPAAALIGPEYQQVFFMETDNKLSMHKTYRFLAAMFGEVALTAPPQVYQRQRPVLHAPFKREKMRRYIEIMQEEVQAWLDGLGECGELELTGEMIRLVQNVAGHALMGADFHHRMGREFWDQYKVLSQGLDPVLPPNLPLPKFYRRDRAKAKLRALLEPVIAERRLNPEGYDDFLQEFVNARYADGTPVEDEVMLSLILGLMFAGHETTAGQAAWSIIQLIQNPWYLDRVREELERELPPEGIDMDGDVLRALEHVEWAVRETERMRPSVDLLLRYVEEEIEAGDYRIPAGWVVFVSPAVAHRLPEWFGDPECYDPLRFAPGREEDRRHRFALIGFGGGTHKCTGMNFAYNEMKIILALLFQQYDLELVTGEPRVLSGAGASRPSPTIVRYWRKK